MDNQLGNQYEDFFVKHPEFFYSNTIKAVFLTGILCQKLLNIQYRDRKAIPFRSRLNSLKLSEKLIRRLLVEIQDKLEQYNKNYYKDLETVIAWYLLDSQFELTNNEISFYFVMGMNLSNEFKFKKEEDSNGDE